MDRLLKTPTDWGRDQFIRLLGGIGAVNWAAQFPAFNVRARSDKPGQINHRRYRFSANVHDVQHQCLRIDALPCRYIQYVAGTLNLGSHQIGLVRQAKHLGDVSGRL